MFVCYYQMPYISPQHIVLFRKGINLSAVRIHFEFYYNVSLRLFSLLDQLHLHVQCVQFLWGSALSLSFILLCVLCVSLLARVLMLYLQLAQKKKPVLLVMLCLNMVRAVDGHSCLVFIHLCIYQNNDTYTNVQCFKYIDNRSQNHRNFVMI